MVDITAPHDGFGPLPPDPHRQTRKRFRDDDDDDDGPYPPNKRPPHDEKDSPRKFACPFFVGDRHLYHKCSQREFTRTSDVRQHIERAHIQAPQCSVCGKIFDNSRSRDSVSSDLLGSDRLNRHTHARECQRQPFSIAPGITVEQFDRITEIANQSSRHLSGVDRWLKMYREVFPGVEDPESPYFSRQTNLVQGMREVRAAIQNGELQAFSSTTSAMSATNFGQYEWTIINTFIDAAGQFQPGQSNRATTLANSFQAPYGEPASLHAAQGHVVQLPTNQAVGHGLAADPLAQSHAPRPVQPSHFQHPDWHGNFQSEFGEGPSQPSANQELTWDLFGLSDQYPSDSCRPN